MEFIRLPAFETASARLFTKVDVLELEVELMRDPLAGDLIPGGRGLRKLRRPGAGRGKRGGVRVIYYYVTPQQTVLLIYAYAKSRATDIPKPFLRAIAEAVKAEFP